VTKGTEGKRFLFVTGKGGTGKTTVTAVLALRLASRNQRVLCAMCQSRERLSTLLQGPPVGDTIVTLRENIWAVNMNPVAALSEYGKMVLRVRAVHRAVFENPLVRSFFAATPGLPEWAMLGKAWFHTTERRSDGSPRFDTVILDAPATGHGLDMLRGPRVIVDVAPPGLLRREATRAWNLFSDPLRSGVVVVTLPEEMAVSETLELLDSIRKELKLPVAEVIANGLLPPVFAPMEREQLLRPQPAGRAPGDAALASGARRAQREAAQGQALERLRDNARAPIATLPRLLQPVDSLGAVHALAEQLRPDTVAQRQGACAAGVGGARSG
jgi:anion-transporting  ArsA/GET3 family ATPase